MVQENGMSEQLNLLQLYSWLKGVEGKVNRLSRETETLKMNFTHKMTELVKELKLLNTELVTVKREREGLQSRMDLVIKELQMTAGKEEVLVLKKYIDLWNPIHFATQNDVERMVQEKLAH